MMVHGAGHVRSAVALAAISLVLLTSCSESPQASPQPEASSAPSIDPPTAPPATSVPAPSAAETNRDPATDGPDIPAPEDPAVLDAAFLADIDAQTAAVREDPDSAQMWTALGAALQRASEHGAALTCYEHAAELDDVAAQPRFFAALLHARIGDMERAIDRMTQAAERAPEYAPAFWRLALLLLEDGRPGPSAEAAHRATLIDPTDPAAPLVYARALLQLHNPAGAAAILEPIMARAPDDAYAGQLLARAYRQLGRDEDADRLIDRTPDQPPAWSDPWSRHAAPRHAGDRNTLHTAVALIQRGRFADAALLLEDLVGRLSDDIDVRINLGLAYRNTQRLDDAQHHLEHALTLGDHEMAHLHLAGVHRERAARVRPPDPESLAAAHHHALEVVRITPGYAAGHGMLGEVLLSRGEIEGGLSAFAHATTLDPTNPLWPQRRGMVLAELGRWRDAVADFRRFRDRAPRDPIAYLLLGSALANSGEAPEGLRMLETGLVLAPEHPALLDAVRQIRAAVPGTR